MEEQTFFWKMFSSLAQLLVVVVLVAVVVLWVAWQSFYLI